MARAWTRISVSLILILWGAGAAKAQSIAFPEWTQRFDAARLGDEAHAIATDAQGNSYVTGTITAGTGVNPDQEMMTIKYDSDGHALWRVFLSSPVRAAHGWDVGVDASGNVYVLSLIWLAKNSAGEPTDTEFTVTKYNASGARLWFAFFNNTNVNDSPGKLFVSPDGTVYVNGRLGQGDLVTVKYDTNGKQLWSRLASQQPVPIIGIGVDAKGNVYSASGGAFKYDANGDFLTYIAPQNANHFAGTLSAYHVDAAGNSIMASVSSGSEQSHVAKLDTNGNPLWSYFDDGQPTQSIWRDVTVDGQGNTYVVGTFLALDSNGLPNPNQSSFQLWKINPSGTTRQVKYFNGHADGSGNDQAVAVVTNAIGDVYVTGSSTNAAGTQTDIVTIKYDKSLNLLWTQRYHGAGTGNDAPAGMKGSADGGLLVTGTSNGLGTGPDWVTINYIQDPATPAPTSLTFASQAVGTTSAEQTITITNKAEVAIDITNVEATGDFHETNTCLGFLGPGLKCTVQVTFTPTATGTRKGTLTVLDDWEGSPRKISLAGTGH